jgi:hypothetical protein
MWDVYNKIRELQSQIDELKRRFSKVPIRLAHMESNAPVKLLQATTIRCMGRDRDFIDFGFSGQQYLSFGGDTPTGYPFIVYEVPNKKLDFSVEGNTVFCPGHDYVEGLPVKFSGDDADMPLAHSSQFPTPTKLSGDYGNGGFSAWYYVHNPDTVAGTFELQQGIWNTGIIQTFDATLTPEGQSIGQVQRVQPLRWSFGLYNYPMQLFQLLLEDDGTERGLAGGSAINSGIKTPSFGVGYVRPITKDTIDGTDFDISTPGPGIPIQDRMGWTARRGARGLGITMTFVGYIPFVSKLNYFTTSEYEVLRADIPHWSGSCKPENAP